MENAFEVFMLLDKKNESTKMITNLLVKTKKNQKRILKAAFFETSRVFVWPVAFVTIHLHTTDLGIKQFLSTKVFVVKSNPVWQFDIYVTISGEL